MTEELNNNGQIKKKSQDSSSEVWWQPAIFTFMKLSGWIVIPVLFGTFLGQWLDEKYNTKPWLLLVTIGVAFTISMIGLVRNTMKEYEKINKEAELKKQNNDTRDTNN
jgi:F0F1-type ATP synthase assembly protein I